MKKVDTCCNVIASMKFPYPCCEWVIHIWKRLDIGPSDRSPIHPYLIKLHCKSSQFCFFFFKKKIIQKTLQFIFIKIIIITWSVDPTVESKKKDNFFLKKIILHNQFYFLKNLLIISNFYFISTF